MKKCNTEIMKELKALSQRKATLHQEEKSDCYISYIEGEEKMTSEYNYEAVRKEEVEIMETERKLRAALAYSNATTIVPEFNMTIGECIIYLAQLTQRKEYLENMGSERQLTRKSSAYSNMIEFKEMLYDVKKAKADALEISIIITQLQMAIDRVNLTNMIEV